MATAFTKRQAKQQQSTTEPTTSQPPTNRDVGRDWGRVMDRVTAQGWGRVSDNDEMGDRDSGVDDGVVSSNSDVDTDATIPQRNQPNLSQSPTLSLQMGWTQVQQQ